MAKQWNAEAVETMLTAQGICLQPGRAERLARAAEGLLGASMADPLRDALELECDPAGFPAAMERLRARPIAAQLVGRPFAEATLLAAGRALQRETDWHLRAPPDEAVF